MRRARLSCLCNCPCPSSYLCSSHFYLHRTTNQRTTRLKIRNAYATSANAGFAHVIANLSYGVIFIVGAALRKAGVLSVEAMLVTAFVLIISAPAVSVARNQKNVRLLFLRCAPCATFATVSVCSAFLPSFLPSFIRGLA